MAKIVLGSWVAGFLLSQGGAAMAQSQELVCDLRTCIDYALTQSVAVKEADAKEISQTAAVLYQQTLFRPTLSLDASGTEINGESVSAFSVVGVNDPEVVKKRINYDEYYSINLTFTYPVFKEGVFFGNNPPSVQIAEATRAADTISVYGVRGDVIYSVSQLYLTAVKDQKLLKEQEALIKTEKRKYEVVQSLAEQHLVSDEELKIAELTWISSQSTYEQLQNEFTDAVEQLSKSLGLGPNVVLKINGETPAYGPLVPLETLIDRALVEHPEIRSQRVTVDGARAELDLSRANRLPTLDFITNYSYADDFNPPGNQLFLSLLSLKIPIFDFGQNSAEIRQSQANVIEKQMTAEVVKRGIIQSITVDYSDVRNNASSLKILDIDVQKSQLQLKLVQAKAAQQIVPSTAVLDAEEALIEKRKDRIESEFTLLTSYVELQHTAGVPIGP